MRSIAPGADGSAHAGQLLSCGTGRCGSGATPPSSSRLDGRTSVEGSANTPGRPTSATSTNVAVDPGVDTMSTGSPPTGRKFAPGMPGFASSTAEFVAARSTTATSPREVCVTMA
jgi:hypothetical protein